MKSKVAALLLLFLTQFAPVSAAESKECPLKLPSGVKTISNFSWKIPNNTFFKAPIKTTFCHFDYKGYTYTLIHSTYSKSANLSYAVNQMRKSDGFLFLGVPSGLYSADKSLKYKPGIIYPASVSTDDCGRFGDELFDRTCPSGKASFIYKGSTLLILSNRFEDKKNIKNAPKTLLATISSQNKW